MKILHVLDHYKPHFSGYVFRSSYILKHQIALGLEPVLVVSPKHENTGSAFEMVDGLRVYRTLSEDFGRIPCIREARIIAAIEKRLAAVVEIEKPDVIHAHSPVLNGIAALRVGKKYKIPVVYEIRAFWEDAAVDHGTTTEGSIRYRLTRWLETRVMRGAGHVFTICQGLRGDIVDRGIPDKKVTIIPNCVDAETFKPLPFDPVVAHDLGLQGKTIIGFIGSLYYYEGIDLLVRAFAKILTKSSDCRLLIVGDGPARDEIVALSNELGMGENVIFTGKVPHEKVNSYYSVIDILVYPRKSMRLTELVTPLKPLETMALKKLVTGSNVGGIKELVVDGETGFLFKAGDVSELTKMLESLLNNPESWQHVAEAGRSRVVTHHNWRLAVERYLPVYQKLSLMILR